MTITARGAHFWFTSIGQYEVKSRGQASFLDGVDLKASGYVVAPPSMHPSGVEYRWAEGSLVLGEFWYRRPPPCALELIEDRDYYDSVNGPSLHLEAGRANLSPLISHLRRFTGGLRTPTLNWCAFARLDRHSLQETLDAFYRSPSASADPHASQGDHQERWKAGASSDR